MSELSFLRPYLPYIGAGMLLLLGAELLWSWGTKRAVYNAKETASNIFIFLGLQFSKTLFLGYQAFWLALAIRFAPVQLEPTVITFVLTFFVVDFLYYWQHRTLHELKFFWAFHLVHHSSPWMNLTTSYRLNWFSGLFGVFFFLPAALVGLPPLFIIGSISLNLLYQFPLHTEAIGKLGFLEGWINTPSAHRVHHGSNKIYIDKNYGGVLMIWDRLFGTYQPETEPVRYGITTGFVSHNPFKLITHGFIDLAKGKLNYK
jgi:sterol desaturase/sphingolipid hydroxylase (fatty acid hydroxylase superfamily)